MELRTKLKFCIAFSVIAVILKVIVFASPGWVLVKHVIREPLETGMVDVPENDMRRKEHVSISFGMWYYKVCKCGGKYDDDDDNSEKWDKDDDNDSHEKHMSEGDEKRHHHGHHRKHHRHHKCYHRCYRKNRFQRIDYVGETMKEGKMEDQTFANDIPAEFHDASEFISHSVDFARHARHELAAYVTIGLVLGVIGMIAAIKYSRDGAVGKHSGRLACSTQVLSSFFYWMAIVRTATYIIQLRAIREQAMNHIRDDDVWFSVPWCLVVGAIGAIVMDVSALFHLILISRDRKPAGAEYVFNTEKIGQTKVPIIAPKGYEQLVVPPLYPTEEAGPLPEKQALS